MKLFFILGNQLFPLKNLDRFKKDHLFFMSEDYQLCTYERHHKLKILLFLSSMRSYADKLKENKFKLNYSKIDSTDFKKDYTKKLEKLLKMNKIKEVTSFEIEDKFFETKINNFLKKQNIQWNIIRSPMFLDSREDFKKYLSKTKKPFMAKFYKEKRERLNILLNKDGTPEGGKWSFDEDNRKKLPKNILIPKFPEIKETKHTKSLKPIIEKLFSKHPGDTKKFWFAIANQNFLVSPGCLLNNFSIIGFKLFVCLVSLISGNFGIKIFFGSFFLLSSSKLHFPPSGVPSLFNKIFNLSRFSL